MIPKRFVQLVHVFFIYCLVCSSAIPAAAAPLTAPSSTIDSTNHSAIHRADAESPRLQTAQIAITENGFEPAVLTITEGDSVTWVNQTAVSHQLQCGQQVLLRLPVVANAAAANQVENAVTGADNTKQLDESESNPGAFDHLLPFFESSGRADATSENASVTDAQVSQSDCSGGIAAGESLTFTFTEAGDFPFFLAASLIYQGRIIVETASNPTATAMPSATPTESIDPTPTPTMVPTDAPTDAPTATPTLIPTLVPTPLPDNNDPTLDPVGNQTLIVGDSLRLTLTGSDGDGDVLEFYAEPLPLPANAVLNQSTGVFEFAPDSDQVGSFEIIFIARDVLGGEATETVTITVEAPAVDQSTTLTGRVLDTNSFTLRRSRAEVAVVGATISMLETGLVTTTDSDGYFTLSNIPPGPQVLDIDTSTAATAPDGSPYAGFREKIVLVEDANNVVERPFFLPRIDQSSLTTVDPTTKTMVDNPNLEIEMEVVAFSAQDQDGRDFAGELSISEVPEALAPAALPAELDPGLLITIQPVGVTFDPPAPIVFPNVDDLPPGSEVDIWSLDPNEGIFVVVAIGEVTADGQSIETVSGGIRAADWHMPLPPQPDDDDDDNNDDNQDDDKCCKQNSGSDTDLSTGSLTIEHGLVNYQSLGISRGVNLIYNSLRADPQPIINSNLTISRRGAVPSTVSARLTVGGVDQGVETHWSTAGLSESENEAMRVATQYDASNFDTGLYPYRLTLSSNFGRSSVGTTRAGRSLVNNQKNSPFGAGWGVDGLQQLTQLESGDVLLTDGDGSITLFLRQRAPEELIAATAEVGTPADPQQASANIGQVITLFSDAPVFDENSTVSFTTLDDAGVAATRSVQAEAVAETGDAIAVIVPVDAATGPVFAELGRDVFLQVVPVLDGFTNNDFREGISLSLAGQGFAEGAMSVNFGAVTVEDTDVAGGINVANTNRALSVAIPPAASGVISVTTAGGSSESLIVGPADFTEIIGSATEGTAADAGQPSANIGQLVTILGMGFGTNANVIFASLNDVGEATTVSARVDSVSADGTSATVVVPNGATSGPVSVTGATGQASLQIVPTLTSSTNTDFRPSGTARNLNLIGSGFAEGDTTVRYDDTEIADPDTGRETVDVYFSGTNLSVIIPEAAAGTVSVSTSGGTSNSLLVGPSTLASIQSMAAEGTPADGSQPSANVGQAITIMGQDLNQNTNVIFPTLDDTGVAGTTFTRVSYVSADRTSATVNVPNGADTGDIQIFGAVGTMPLQIVPHLSTFINTDLRPSGTTRALQINGGGFIEGAVSVDFGGTVVADPDPGRNLLDVFAIGTALNVAIPESTTGTIAVTTEGGTSNSLEIGASAFTAIQSTALSGMPTDGTQPSANLGQAITILGSDFGPNTNVFFTTLNAEGVAGTTPARVSHVAADGSFATVTIPNGAVTGDVSVFGAAGSFPLQIVPSIDSFTNAEFKPSDTFRTLGLVGGGFVEGATTVHFGGTDVVDPDTGTNLVDVAGGNTRMDVVIPLNAGGVISVTTPGGSSENIAVGPSAITGVNALANVGTPADAATASANVNQTIIISGTDLGANSSVIFPTINGEGVAGTVSVRVNSVAPNGSTATVIVPNGAATGNLTLSGATGSATVQIVPHINTFNNSTFAAGSNLRLNGGGFVEGTTTINFGAVTVTDPDTGPNQVDIIGSGTTLNVTIPAAPEATVSVVTAGGTSNAVDMTLPTVEIRSPKANEAVAENSTITIRVTAMDNAALEPVEFLVDSTVQFTDTTAPYEFTYVVPAFDAAGTNTVTLGARATDADANTTDATDVVINIVESILAIDATAEVGAPADAGQASANVGQMITVFGLGLTTNSEVVFPTANNAGVATTANIRVINVGPDGRSARVVVPNGATTGDLQIDGMPATARLQIVPLIESYTNSDFKDSGTSATMRLLGSGFVEGDATVSFGAASVVDPDEGNITIDVINSGTSLFSIIPADATASVTVATAGGSSNALLVGPAGFGAIVGTALDGTPADATQPSANVGQTIAIQGINLTPNTTILFAGTDNNGVATTTPIRVSGVSADGTQASVIVPNGASTGSISVFGTADEFDLQIVPRIDTVNNNNFAPSGQSQALDLRGAGFVEGDTIVDFGTVAVTDPDTGTNSIDVRSTGTVLFSIIPANASGTISVTTSGGTSNPLIVGPASFSAVQATAEMGTAADAGQAAANVGQAITLIGAGLKPNTNVVFPTVDDQGVAASVSVRVNNVSATGDSATVIVPTAAATGGIQLHGVDASFPLQIVPRLTTFSNRDFNPSGTARNLRLNGGGFIEGVTSVQFGLIEVADEDTGPNSVDVRGFGTLIDAVIPADGAGIVSVTTPGGTSNELSVGPTALTGIESSAQLGAAADESLPSANVGQLVTVRGTDLGRNTNVLFATSDDNGVPGETAVRVSGANADGTIATIVIPNNARTGDVSIAGATGSMFLQIVPTINTFNLTDLTAGTNLRLNGNGFVEGDIEIRFGNVPQADPDTGPNTVNVRGSGTIVDATIPSNPGENVRVVTAGGASNLVNVQPDPIDLLAPAPVPVINPSSDPRDFRSPDGNFNTLVENTDGTFAYLMKDGTRYTFSADGLQTSYVDRNENTMAYAYNGRGQLTKITDPVGLETTLAYQGDHLSSITDPAERETLFGHDAEGNLTTITDPDGSMRQFGYGDRHRLTTQISKRGFTTQYQYNFAGRHVKSIWPDGSTREVAPSQMVGVVDLESGIGTSDNPAPLVRPEAVQATFTDGEGRIATYGTGHFGEATQVNNTSGQSAVLERNEDGNLTRQTLSNGAIYTYSYDEVGNRTERVDSTVNSTFQFSYDNPFNQASSITDSYGNTSQFDYDNDGNLTRAVSPIGIEMSFTYDDEGQPTSFVDPLGTETSITYNSEGNPTQVTSGSGADARTTSMTYTADGQVKQMVNPLGQVHTFTYDAFGRISSETLPTSRTIAYEYNEEGWVSSIKPPEQPAHQFGYDESGNMVSYIPPTIDGSDNTQTTYTYDSSLQLSTITRPDGKQITYEYDSGGRVKAQVQPRGTIVFNYMADTGQLANVIAPEAIQNSYTYNGALVTGITTSGPVTGTVGLMYDSNYRITQDQVNGDSVSYEYDADDELIRAGDLVFEHHATKGLLTNSTLDKIADQWQYNEFGELTQYSVRHDETTAPLLYDVVYTRDKLGRVAGKIETLAGETTVNEYAYDEAGNLVSVSANGTPIAEYTYDANGNRLSGPDNAIGVYDAQDRLLSYNGIDYSYSPNGELKTKTVNGQAISYNYDVTANLMAVSLPDGTEISYLIDGQGRRIGKKVNNELVQGFLYQDQLNPLAVLDGNGTVTHRFVYGSRVNVPDYMLKDGSTFRYVTDHLGSVRLVVNAQSGEVAQRIDYDEWGRVIQDTNPGFQPFGFAGGLYDTDTGLVRFGARDYDAEMGRWTTKDPIGFNGGDTNLYKYAGNDPINGVDLMGTVDDPGFWESMIPVWGSGKQAIHDFQCGNWGWGLFNTAMAISDVFLVKSLATAAGKGLWKTGSNTWSATSKWLSKTGWREFKGQHMHHWLLHRNQGIGKYAPDWLKNQPWNLMPMPNEAFHQAIHGKGPNAFNLAGRLWHGTPSWSKAGGLSTGGRAANEGRDSGDCGCN